MGDMNNIRVTSFNCKNYKTSVNEIYELCDNCDILVLQETWLLEVDLSLLSNIHTQFYAKGISSVNVESGILKGRPHGGIAILWKKCFANRCKIIDFQDDKLLGLEVQHKDGKLLIVNAYLPYCADINIDEYAYYLGKIESIFSDYDSPYIYVIGDFNADISGWHSGQVTHKFGQDLLGFCKNEGFVMSDKELCSACDTYTFYSDAHCKTSWLDHVLTTVSGHSLINNIAIHYDTVTSDHHPITMHLACSYNIECCSQENAIKRNCIKWDELNPDDLACFKAKSDLYLSEVYLDHSLILCDDPSCKDPGHTAAISRMYNDIINALKLSGDYLVKQASNGPKQKLGWNEYCKVAHDHAQTTYLMWRDAGRPRDGLLFDEMKKSRAYFKCVLRKCRKDKTKNSADLLANKLLTKNDKEFWKEIKKLSSNHVPIASTVNNVTHKKNVPNMWRTHFESLLNSSKDISLKSCVVQVLSKPEGYFFERFTASDVIEAVKSIKHGKSAGVDDSYGEHFIHAHECINVLLRLVLMP